MWTRWSDLGFGGIDPAFGDLRREMDRLFSEFQRDWGLTSEAGAGFPRAHRSGWPRISVHDAGSQLLLRAEVPGISEKDLDITVHQTSLTLRGERKAETPQGYAVHRQERGPLTFSRSFTLPCRVDSEKVTANLKNGVLEMTLPKAAEAQPRQIQVKAS